MGRKPAAVAEELAVDVTRFIDAVREEVTALMLEGVQKSASFCASVCAQRIVEARREFLHNKHTEDLRDVDRHRHGGGAGGNARSPFSGVTASPFSPATTIMPMGGQCVPSLMPAPGSPQHYVRPPVSLFGGQVSDVPAGAAPPAALVSPTAVHQPQLEPMTPLSEVPSRAELASPACEAVIVDACAAVQTLEVRTQMAAQAMDLLDEALRTAAGMGAASSSCPEEAQAQAAEAWQDAPGGAPCRPADAERADLAPPADAADAGREIASCGEGDDSSRCDAPLGADAGVVRSPALPSDERSQARGRDLASRGAGGGGGRCAGMELDVPLGAEAGVLGSPAMQSEDRSHTAGRTVTISPSPPESCDDLPLGGPVVAQPTVTDLLSPWEPPCSEEGLVDVQAEAVRLEGQELGAAAWRSGAGRREACAEGTRCRRRDAAHLAAQAHPFDADYAPACRECGLEPEVLSLWGLFTWVDLFSTGRASRAELDTALRLLSQLRERRQAESNSNEQQAPQYTRFSDEVWEELDVHDKGTLTFSEFAGWAGPRLGLPLGVRHLFTMDDLEGVHACGVVGCPCEGFRGQTPKGPCAGGCGFARTWHPTHCCFGCKKSPGSHGRKCGKIPVRFASQWSAEDDFCKSVDEVADGAASSRDSSCNGLRLCLCGHKRSAHAQRLPTCGEVPFPPYWSHIPDGSKRLELIELTLSECEMLQSLLDATHRRVWTRDRRRHNPTAPNVPQGYRLVRAFRSENAASWQKYCIRRKLMQDSLSQDPTGSFVVYDDVLSTAAWTACSGASSERLSSQINEWYVFHGTSFPAAESICRGDFRVQRAGERTGTLYGRGVYCAESITKSDEYAIPNKDGEFTVLLCRALGGRVRYTEDDVPDQEELLRDCIEGPFSCVLGDRARCRGTFREFVFFDTELLYAEYLLQYTRKS